MSPVANALADQLVKEYIRIEVKDGYRKPYRGQKVVRLYFRNSLIRKGPITELKEIEDLAENLRRELRCIIVGAGRGWTPRQRMINRHN